MIHSMTGFGRASGALSPRYFATVTAKSVNHRFLEVSVRLPEYMWDMEAPLRAIASEMFSRGKVDLSIRIQRTQQKAVRLRELTLPSQQVPEAVVREREQLRILLRRSLARG